MTGVELRYPVNALASYHYFKNADMARLARGGLRVIADSGAFSAETQGTPVDIDEFAQWATANRRTLHMGGITRRDRQP